MSQPSSESATTGCSALIRPADNGFRVLAALAADKHGRGNRLIGLHLTMVLIMACLVQAMLLRDRHCWWRGAERMDLPRIA
ncbi:hypothetical protein [Humibacillus sp. DSM 29435]|uniref:hypothetical protein n=1 Tax=Humibacillus sp. DSM 29435 TaxID=1869167 RepID=UPI00111317A9|nr:hypothetical protein [Humibacillus sp. DSM 29435]